MDIGLIFPNRHACDGGTEEINCRALVDWRLCFQDRYPRQIRDAALMQLSNYGGHPRLRPKEMTVKSLSRKTSKLKCMYVRTANRHRCTARVEQDERVSVLQGTRQKIGRTFGIRPAPVAILG